MLNSNLVYNVARAQFIRRNVEKFALNDMVWTSSSNDSLSEYKAWTTMTDNDRKIWIDKAEKWLELLKDNRPANYKILEQGFLSIDDE